MEKSDFLDETTDGQKCCIGSTSSRSECYTPKRYVVIALLFLGMVICNAQRVNIGVTVIEFLENAPHTNPEDCTSNVSSLFYVFVVPLLSCHAICFVLFVL